MRPGAYRLENSRLGAGDNFGPVTKSLMTWLDGIDNEANGVHNNSAAIWKNKYNGGGRDGDLYGTVSWGADHLSFPCLKSSYVSLRKLEASYPTIEAVFETTNAATVQNIVSCLNTGGYALFLDGNGNVGPYLRLGGSYYSAYVPIAANTKYHLVGTYDKSNIRVYLNGVQGTPNPQTGNLGYQVSTYTILGGNPGTTASDSEYFGGKLYSFRFYSRALTEDEVAQNFAFEKLRYAIP